MKYLPFILALSLISCTIAPTPLPNGKGGVANFKQVGGKWSLTYNADGSMMLIGDNEISWQHTMQTAAALGMGVIGYLEKKITETTAQLANANLTSLERFRLESDLAKFNSQLAYAKSLEGIKGGAPLGPVKFQ